MPVDSTQIAPRTRTVGVVANPVGRGARQAVAAVEELCAGHGWSAPLVLHTTVTDPGPGQAAHLVAERVDQIVVIGGDGTVRAVAAVLAQAQSRGQEVTLGVLATGTANLLAGCLGLPVPPARRSDQIAHWAAAAEAALQPQTTVIDLGLARLHRNDGSVDEEVFTVVAGAGMDAAAFARTSEGAKRRFGWISYFASLVAELGGRHYPIALRVDDDDEQVIGVQSVLLGNGGRLPHGISLIPRARVGDGRLDLLLIQPRTVIGWVPVGIGVLAGLRGRFSGLHDRAVSKIALRTSTPIPVHLDGDPVGEVVALSGDVWPAALRVCTALQDPARAAERIHAHQKGWTQRFDEWEVVQEFLALKGIQLTRLKSLVRSTGHHHDLEKLVFTDIDDEQLRVRLLDHFATQAVRARQAGRAATRVLSDIDDTLRSALHDERFPRGTIYPGVVEFYRAIDSGEASDPQSPGDLTFITARPGGVVGAVENLTRGSLAGVGLPPHSVLSGTARTMVSNSAMAERKLLNFLRHRQLFPEADLVFVGDSGQGDVEVGTKMLQDAPEVMRAVFIHDVVDTSEQERKSLRDKGIIVFDTYLGAAVEGHALGLVEPDDLDRVAEAAKEQLEAIDFDDDEQRETAAELLRRDLDRFAELSR